MWGNEYKRTWLRHDSKSFIDSLRIAETTIKRQFWPAEKTVNQKPTRTDKNG